MDRSLPQQASGRQTCLRCGGKTVQPRQRPGRTIHYRTIAALPLPADLPIPTCSRCQAEYLDPEDSGRLDRILSALYVAELRRLACEAIKILRQHISQRKLELQLGLSQGYLSRLLANSGNPSPPLVLLLAQLAKDPESRLSEAERFWREIRPPHNLQDSQRSAPTNLRRKGTRSPTLKQEHTNHERTKQEPESQESPAHPVDDGEAEGPRPAKRVQ